MFNFSFFQRPGKHTTGKSHGVSPRTRTTNRGIADGQRVVPGVTRPTPAGRQSQVWALA